MTSPIVYLMLFVDDKILEFLRESDVQNIDFNLNKLNLICVFLFFGFHFMFLYDGSEWSFNFTLGQRF